MINNDKYGVPEQPSISPMPEIKKREQKDDDLKLVIKELHNISQELNTLNKILRRRG